jgi:hypothetical protein
MCVVWSWKTLNSYKSEREKFKTVRSTHLKTHKLLQVCKQVVYKCVHKLSTSCVRTAYSHAVVVTSLEKAANNL